MKLFETESTALRIALASTVILLHCVGAAEFALDNRTDLDVAVVQAGPNTQEDWGDDLLDTDSVLVARHSRRFSVEAGDKCVFDVRAVFSNGQIQKFMDVDLCENSAGEPLLSGEVAVLVLDGKADDRIVVVFNSSGAPIQDIRISPDDEDQWGPNRLEEGTAVAPSADRMVLLRGHGARCRFDIRLETPDKTVEFRDRDFCEDFEITYYDGKHLTVANEGLEDVYVVRVAPDHGSQGWSEDLLGHAIILSGEAGVVTTHHFRNEQCVFNVQIQDAEGRDYSYEGANLCQDEPVLVHAPQASNDRNAALAREDFDPGETFRDCEDWGCPWMVVVSGGEFERGSWDRDEETPVTKVTVPGPFAVGQFEVSVGQFGEFVRETDHDGADRCHVRKGSRWRLTDGRNWRNPGFDQDDSHPVVCVNWDDAIAYTTWLADRTGLPYRLLTEAEAELLSLSSAIEFERSGRANCRNCGGQWDGKSTSPVGRLRPDRLGLSGVFGNAAEWVQDCFQSGYSNAPRDGSAWSPPSCERRVVRGGCWATRAEELRATGRDHGNSGRRSTCVGFRVARAIGGN